MSAIAIALIVFTCVFGSALLGLFLRALLPENHLSPESKDVVKLAIGSDRDDGSPRPGLDHRVGKKFI
jgi:hypothetical protein